MIDPVAFSPNGIGRSNFYHAILQNFYQEGCSHILRFCMTHTLSTRATRTRTATITKLNMPLARYCERV